MPVHSKEFSYCGVLFWRGTGHHELKYSQLKLDKIQNPVDSNKIITYIHAVQCRCI